MKQLLLSFILLLFAANSYADRIYIMNAGGYNTAPANLIAAMQANGHTVINNTSTLGSLPAGFTSKCVDPVNGYDWLCFFGETSYTGLTAAIKSYIDVGGKVFYQYEVSCCTQSSASAASIAASITGLGITENPQSYIGFSGVGGGGWEATNISCCANFQGDAYKGMDGVPVANQLQATANIAGSSPAISSCPAFGFYFTTTDFTGSADKGGFIGLGDMNAWYHGSEPSATVDVSVVNYFFPNASTTCFLFPPGCLQTFASPSGGVTGTIASNAPICAGQTLNLTSTSPTGTSFSWTGPNGFTSSLQNPTIPNAQAVNEGTYSVTISDGACSVTLNITVALGGGITGSASSNAPICPGQTLNLTSTSPTGTSYSWTGPNGFTSNSQNPTIPNAQSVNEGTYTVTISDGSCSSTFTTIVALGGGLTGSASSNAPICPGQQLDLSATSTTGTTFSWTGPNGFTSNSQNPTIPNAQAVNEGTYTVVISNGACSSSFTTSVALTNTANPVITASGPYCENGAAVTLNASIAGGTWSGTGITNASAGTFDPSVAGLGTHTITYNITVGCVGSDTQNFDVNAVPTVTSSDVVTCPGKPVALQANGADTYVWTPSTGLNTTTGSTVISTVGSNITYTVTGTTSGCSSSTTATVAVSSGFVAIGNVSPNPVSSYEPTVTLTAGPAGSTFLWVFQDGTTSTSQSFEHTFTGPAGNQEVIMIATSPQGCTDTVRFIVYMESDLIFYVPNAFTPDGDEFNQSFQPVFTAGFDPYNFEMTIFNRWGEIVFETHDALVGWDGTYHDKLVQDGTYTWSLKFKSPKTDEKYEYQGHLSVFR